MISKDELSLYYFVKEATVAIKLACRTHWSDRYEFKKAMRRVASKKLPDVGLQGREAFVNFALDLYDIMRRSGPDALEMGAMAESEHQAWMRAWYKILNTKMGTPE